MVANNIKTLTSYKYTVSLQYLNIRQKLSTTIKNECVKSVIIDHNYDKNCMPVIYINLRLDKALVDDMIKNDNYREVIPGFKVLSRKDQ